MSAEYNILRYCFCLLLCNTPVGVCKGKVPKKINAYLEKMHSNKVKHLMKHV